VGALLADARCGLENQQRRLIAVDARLPLLSPLALFILLLADNLQNTLKGTITFTTLLALFQVSPTMCVNYVFFCRVEAGVHCQAIDLTIDRLSGYICLYIQIPEI
jgi:hypothetical protein